MIILIYIKKAVRLLLVIIGNLSHQLMNKTVIMIAVNFCGAKVIIYIIQIVGLKKFEQLIFKPQYIQLLDNTSKSKLVEFMCNLSH